MLREPGVVFIQCHVLSVHVCTCTCVSCILYLICCFVLLLKVLNQKLMAQSEKILVHNHNMQKNFNMKNAGQQHIIQEQRVYG